MMQYQVIRTHISPYQGKEFKAREKELLESLSGIFYTEESLNPQMPTILITNTHTQLSKISPALLNQTELILHPNSGYDHFASEEEIWIKKPLIVGHVIRAQAVAEYSLASLFQGVTQLPQHLSWSADRSWKRSLLKDMKICLFGHGHIGKILERTLEALGADLSIVDPFSQVKGHHKKWQELNLKEFQAVIACCSLNPTSVEVFDEDFFDHAHPDLIFINGARGKLVKEDALKDFLLSHPKAQAFLDVFQEEPFTDKWHHFPQVWKTSHIAGVYDGLDQGILDFEFGMIKDFLSMKRSEFLDKYRHENLQHKLKQGILI
jgi:phosphoglycerate dehydrogenase-like enzyme